MNNASEVAVTLAPELYELLRDEARKLGVAMEWLVASLVVDTLDTHSTEAAMA